MAAAELRKAQLALEDLQRVQRQKDEEYRAAEEKAWAAESVIDIANRLTTFVTTSIGAEVQINRGYLSKLFESSAEDGVNQDSSGRFYYGSYRIPAPN